MFATGQCRLTCIVVTPIPNKFRPNTGTSQKAWFCALQPYQNRPATTSGNPTIMAGNLNSASRSPPFLLISNREMRSLVLPNTIAAIKHPVVAPRYVRPDAPVEKSYWSWKMRPSEVEIKFIAPETIEMIREQAIMTGEKNRSLSGLFIARDSSSTSSGFVGVGSSASDSR